MHRKKFNVICVLLIGFFLASSCKKEARQSKMAGLLAFNIPALDVPAFTINQFNNTAYNIDSVPYTTSLRTLKATFELTPGAVLKVGDTVQTSGETVNDFRKPVTYTVVAEDGKTLQTYTVRVISTIDPKAVTWERTSEEGFGAYMGASTTLVPGRIYVAAATPGMPFLSGLFYSADGRTWQRGKTAVGGNNADTLPVTAYSRMATFDTSLWILGGRTKDAVTNKIWHSRDGEKWTAVQDDPNRWGPRERLNAVVYKNKLWIIGGSQYPAGGNPTASGEALNDVWNSADGRSWSRVTAAANFPARVNPAVFLYKDRIYITGGKDNNQQYLADMWYTEDGATWTKVEAATPPPAREGHQVLVNKTQLLLIGGANGGNTYGDLWVSENDGAAWAQITDPDDSRALPEGFPKRAWYEAFTGGTAIWIIGGLDGGNPVKEIWRGRTN